MAIARRSWSWLANKKQRELELLMDFHGLLPAQISGDIELIRTLLLEVVGAACLLQAWLPLHRVSQARLLLNRGRGIQARLRRHRFGGSQLQQKVWQER